MAAPTIVGITFYPADNGTQLGSTVTIVRSSLPSYQVGDALVLVPLTRATGFQGSYNVTTTGGALWQQIMPPYATNITNVSYGMWGTRIGATLSADPIIDNGGSSSPMQVAAIVLRPSAGMVIDLDRMFGTDATAYPNGSKASNVTFTNTGIATSQNDVLGLFLFMSIGPRTWSGPTAGFTLEAQARNASGSGLSLAILSKTYATPSATGSVSLTQSVATAGAVALMTFYEHATPSTLGALSYVDWWETAEGAYSQAGLEANDNTTGLTWSVATNTGTKMSVDAAAEMTLPFKVAGVSDTGVQGLAYNGDTLSQDAYARATLAASKTDVTMTMLMKFTASMRSSFTEHDALYGNGVSGGGWIVKLQDDRYSTNGGVCLHDSTLHSYFTTIPLLINTPYILCVHAIQNDPATARLRVYDLSLNQIGFESATGAINEPLGSFDVGSEVGGDAITGLKIYFDDILGDFTNKRWPLVGVDSAASLSRPGKPFLQAVKRASFF